MAKVLRTARRFAFASAFDVACSQFGGDGDSTLNVAKILGRCTRSVQDWRSGAKPCPMWALELLRLTHSERLSQIQRMTGRYRSVRKFFAESESRLRDNLLDLYGGFAANDSCAVVSLSVEGAVD